MKYLFSYACLLLTISVHAQVSDNFNTYDNVKIISIGFTQQGIRIDDLNLALEANGYSSIGPYLSVVTINISSSYNNRLSFFYGGDIGLGKDGAKTIKYQKIQYYRFYGGIEYNAFTAQRFLMIARVALSNSTIALRLYDSKADTSFDNYISGASDTKRLTTGTWGIDLGLQARIRSGQHTMLSIAGGYVMAMGNSEWKHDIVSLNKTPNIQLGTWYIGVRTGLLFHRQIKQITDHLSNTAMKDDITNSTPL